MGFLDYTSATYHYYLGSQSTKMLKSRNQNNPLAHNYAHTNSRSSNMNRDDDDDEDHDSSTNKSAMLNGNHCGSTVSGGNSSSPISGQVHAFKLTNTASSCMISLNPIKQNGHMADIKCKISDSDKVRINNSHSRNFKKNPRQNRDYLGIDRSDAAETMPDEEELDLLFAKVLATMDLPPDKSKVLWSYDKDKKWELIRDQRRVQAKQEPRYYLAKLRSYRNNPMSNLRQQVTSRFQVPKLKNRKADAENGSVKNGCSTQILRDLEISLRTNSIEWVREFLSEKNNGLDAIVDYLIFRLSMLHSEQLSTQISNDSKQHTSLTNPIQAQLTSFMNSSPNNSLSSLIFNQKTSDNPKSCTDASSGSQERKHLSTAVEDIHVCIMCLRSIMNNKKGFNMVMEHQQAINCLALSLNFTSIRTKTLILELLAAICLVKGGHELIASAFDHFKASFKEQRRFETLVFHFRNQEKFDVDFMVSCLQFINIIVHSQDDMNYRTHLQYEFTNLGLDDHLEKLKQNESDELHLQIQTYLDNRIDVSSLAEEAEVKNGALEQVQQLIEKLSISNELQTQLQLNYQVLDGKLQEEMKKNEELIKSNEECKALVTKLRKQLEQRDGYNQRPILGIHPTPGDSMSDDAGCVDQSSLNHAMKNPTNSILVPIRSAQDMNAKDRSTTTKILVNSQNGCNPVKKAPAPAPPPPPPPPPLHHSTILQSSNQLESAPPPPPPPPPMMLASSVSVGHKKGLAPQPPMAQLSHGDQQLKSLRLAQGSEDSNANINCDMMTLKKTFSTQYKLPTFNWSTLKPNQVRGTIFNEFHDEDKIIKSIDFKDFEEQFKLGHRTNKAKNLTRNNVAGDNTNLDGSQESELNTSTANSNDEGTNVSKGSNPGAQTKRFKQPEKISFMEHNRLRNMAISLRKLATPTSLLVSAINRLDIEQLPLDSLEILMRMIPSPQEVKAYHEYESVQGKSVDALTDEDKFLCHMSKIDRLDCKVRTMFYMKNLDTNTGNHSGNSLSSAHSISSSNTDSADLLSSTKAKIESIETASKSLRTSDGIRTLLEYILVFGNYLNSSSRSLASAPAYGFKLQALDMVTEARSTQDKSRNLLHFIVDTIMKNLSPRERASISSIGTPSRNSVDSESQQDQIPSHLRSMAGMKRLSPLAHIDQESIRMPYRFESLMSELEQAANVSLETLLIETNELEKGMDLCIKELKLRCAAADALEQQKLQQQHNQPHANLSPDQNSPDSIKNPTDESISRLQRFIKTRSHEVVELRELVRRAQLEFNECAQYFGENPRTIESSSLFSIFLRNLKNFRQCLIDNKMIEKRKFDEELRKQIQEQQAIRAQKKRLASQGCHQTPNNNNNTLANDQSHSLSIKDRGVIAGEVRGQFDSESGRLLHQDEVSHGTLDILITGLKVEPYRRVEGLRKSMRRLERQSFGAG